MKATVTRLIRRYIPKQGVQIVEEAYRRSRVRLVSAYYGNPARSLRVIGVTGTNGKTTTVNFLNEILKQAGYTTAMFSTAVIEVDGVAKRNDLNATVATTSAMQRFFRMAKNAQVDFAILEFPSHALHQHKLDTVPVEVAIMTNLTQDHLDYHKTMERYAAAKAKLFEKRPKVIVLNRDDEWFDYFNKFKAVSKKVSYGKNPEADVHIENVTLFRKGTELRIKHDGSVLDLASALPGDFNAYNLAAAASAALMLGVSSDDIKEGAANLEAIPGRFERIEEITEYDVIVDYAHTPDGLEKLLEAARGISKGNVTLVFGACGDRDKIKRPIMGRIAAELADSIVLTDEESYNEDPAQIRDQIMKGISEASGTTKTTEVADRRDAIKYALQHAKKQDTILITGMGHEMYRIIEGKRIPWNDSQVVRELITEIREKKA